MNLLLRRATDSDLAALCLADGRAFGFHHTDADVADFRARFEPDRFLLACDPDPATIVGTTGDFPFDVTLPGGATLPAPGVTWVSVAVTHRRRGILTALLREQHRSFVAAGAAVSLLTASEGGIYGRFGYGAATVRRSVEISRRRVAFRSGVPDPGGVRQVDTDELRTLGPPIHRRWAAVTPGAVSRNAVTWDSRLRDPEYGRHGGTALFHLAHPDGYASYRLAHGSSTCHVTEMFAVTEQAHVALWRILLGLDLVETVAAYSRPLDDTLPDLLTDPRQVRTTGLGDGMWARVLDVPAALSARRYGVELDVVLEVHDPFLDLGGRFRLRGGPDGADCARIDVATDVAGGSAAGAVTLDVAALGALLFGGRRAGTLARAGLLESDDPATLRRLDLALLAERSPQHGTEF